MTKIKFAKIILIFILLLPFSGHTLEVEEKEILLRPRAPRVEHIFLEQESIIAFYEVNHIAEYKKLIPNIFSMPERPICKVAVYDFYKMESGPPYSEALVQILVKYRKPQSGEEIARIVFFNDVGYKRRGLMGQVCRLPQSPEKGDI